MASGTYVRDAADLGALEVMVVELLDGGSKISGSLVLDEAVKSQSKCLNT